MHKMCSKVVTDSECILVSFLSGTMLVCTKGTGHLPASSGLYGSLLGQLMPAPSNSMLEVAV
jgi:hypothetical protein